MLERAHAMPTHLLGETAATIQTYDVIGIESADHTDFVQHVAMCQGSISVTRDSSAIIKATHMIPPLWTDVPLGAVVHCFGTAHLDENDVPRIGTFIAERKSEFDAEVKRRKQSRQWRGGSSKELGKDQYTIIPHVRWPDQDRPYCQFSCAGFVIEAYRAADIDLIHHDFPTCAQDTLKVTYGVFPEFDDRGFREEKGLTGDGPWPVLLPGYICNAMNRPRGEIIANAFPANQGDEFFPSRRLPQVEQDANPTDPTNPTDTDASPPNPGS